MEPFDLWLLENYGFEANGTPIKNKPPMFLTSDGTFNVDGYEKWKDEKRKEWIHSI